MAMGTQMMAGLVCLPLVLVAPPGVPSPAVVASVLALGVLSSGVAYVMYFRLIADIGATRALTVTYLMPMFGVLFGTLFLGEALTVQTLAGALIVIAGTVLVLRG